MDIKDKDNEDYEDDEDNNLDANEDDDDEADYYYFEDNRSSILGRASKARLDPHCPHTPCVSLCC